MGGRIYSRTVVTLVAAMLGIGTAGAQEEQPVNLGNFSVSGDRDSEEFTDAKIERPRIKRDSVSFESKPDAPQFDLAPMGKPSPEPAPSRSKPARSGRSKPESSKSATATGSGPEPSGRAGTSATVEDRSIKPVNITAPDYPRRAVRKKLNGEVTVAFTVNEEGETEDIEVVAADPRGVFERAATKAVSEWTFKPAVRNGSPVRERVKQTIQFDLGR